MLRISRALFAVAAAASLHLGALTALGSGYLHTLGVTNLDMNDRPIVLRGVDLGSWLWPEYYMMGSLSLPAYGNAGTGTGGIANYYDGLVAAIQDVLGGDTNLTAQVLGAYWSNFITPADIAFLHTNGFNSVRVPFTFEEFFHVTNWANNYPANGYDINTGFTYLDNLVSWCSSNGIYVIPDMHVAPGGPNNYSVTNYGGALNTNTASVFANPANLALAEHLWGRIAAHYATNPWIGGYDLLNEPVNTSLGGQVGSPILANTYSNLVKTIRAVDPNHLLLCEGDYYASTLWDVDNTGWNDPDTNLSFSDHDYGSPLPLGTANRSTCVGANVPDWAGEFGINSTLWYNQILATTYQNPVTLNSSGRTATITEGYCFWAYKSTQFYTVVENPQTAGWYALKAYWASGNTLARPSVTNAFQWLMAYAQACNFTNCLVHPEIIDALTRPATNAASTGFEQAALPYKTGATIPGKIFAVDYDMGALNVAYVDTVSEDEANRGPSGTAWNSGWYGRDDGVDTTTCEDPGTLLKVGYNDAGEWQRHTVTCTPGTYQLYVRYAGGATGGQIRLSLLTLNPTNNALILGSNNLTGTLTLAAPYQSWTTYLTTNVTVTVTNSGAASLQIDVVSPGYDLAWVEFVPTSGPLLPPIGETVIGAPGGRQADLAAAGGNMQAALWWPPVDGATSYNIYRASTSGGPYAPISPTGSVAAPSYLDSGMVNGQIYYYVLTSVNANGESAYSAEISVRPSASGLPALWMDQDVGLVSDWSGDSADVGFSGSAAVSNGIDTVSGSGKDIWGNADSFHWTYLPVWGDCTNIARVSGLTDTDPWAKAGVMIRESFNQDSVNAYMAMTASNGALFSFRSSTGNSSSSAGQGSVSAPYWVKLVRSGNTFTGYTSADGVGWLEIGSTVIPMATNAFAGLAVTAHNNTLVNTATFDHVSIAGQFIQPASVRLAGALSGANIVLSWPSRASGFALYAAPSLDPPVAWQAVTNAPIAQGANWQVTLPLSGSSSFFRLAQSR